jgi:glycosyltransferase involved in cell wall biosynthesis
VKVSIILPTYNRASLIKSSIRSVLNQTYQDFELIIVDDCSDDATGKIVSEFDDRRINYIYLDKHQGAAFARNEGIKIAKGNFIAFQDSDDEWMPDKLEKQIGIFEKACPDVGVVYSDMLKSRLGSADEYVSLPRITPEQGIIYKRALSGRLMGLGLVSTLIRKKCFDEAGLFDESLPRHMDLELLIRISKSYLFLHMPEPLVKYRVTEDSISMDLNALLTSEKIIFEKYYDDIRINNRLLGKYLYNLGTLSCQLGQMRQGREYIFRAFVAVPTNFKFLGSLAVSLSGKKIFSYLVQKKNELIKKRLKEKKVNPIITVLFAVHTTVIGGAELYLLKLLKHLDRKKFFPVVIVPDEGCLNQRLKQIGVETQVVALGPFQRKKILPHIRSVFNVFKQIKRYNPLIVHSFTRPAQYYCAWAAKIAGKFNICHFHDIIDWKDYLQFSNWSIACSDLVIAVSHAAEECLLKGNIREEKIFVINNGIDMREFEKKTDVKKNRTEFKVKEKGFLVAAVGRIVPEKGFDVFIKAAAEVLKHIPDVKFIVVGGASEGSSGSSYLDLLKSLVKESGIEKNLIFTGFREDVPDIIKSVDLIVLSSMMDACPTVLLESMAAAKPVVASNVGGIPEIIDDDVTGVLFSAGDFQDLAKKMTKLLSDEKYRLNLGQAGKNKVKECYLIDDKVRRLEKIYYEVLNRNQTYGKNKNSNRCA